MPERPVSSRVHLNRMPEWDFCFDCRKISNWEWLEDMLERDPCGGCADFPLSGFNGGKNSWCHLSRTIATLQESGLCVVIPHDDPFSP